MPNPHRYGASDYQNEVGGNPYLEQVGDTVSMETLILPRAAHLPGRKFQPGDILFEPRGYSDSRLYPGTGMWV